MLDKEQHKILLRSTCTVRVFIMKMANNLFNSYLSYQILKTITGCGVTIRRTSSLGASHLEPR